MPIDRMTAALAAHVAQLEDSGTAKGVESVVVQAHPPAGERGPRFNLAGEGEREFIRMNSNSYLGLSLREDVIAAEEQGAARFGAGPGAVRFISGTYESHVALEKKLAAFHGREAGMIFSAAYATIMGTISPLVTKETIVISDELNHNCIINAVRLSRPLDKAYLPPSGSCRSGAPDRRRQGESAARAGDHRRHLLACGAITRRSTRSWRSLPATTRPFRENVVVVVDDSHGVGAFGATGRGTEEYTGSPPVDMLVGTLGKAFGVNGGYVVGNDVLDPLPARERAVLHLLEPDHRERGQRGAQSAGDSRFERGRGAARQAPALDGAIRERAGRSRLRDHPGRASRRAADGA